MHINLSIMHMRVCVASSQWRELATQWIPPPLPAVEPFIWQEVEEFSPLSHLLGAAPV